jgi:hypothetical protein
MAKAAREAMSLDESLNEVSIVDKFVELQQIVTGCFNQQTWYLTEICMSGIATLLLEDVKNPVGINLEGTPSSGKTTVLSFFYPDPAWSESEKESWIVYKTDSFTPAAFVSHAANVKAKELKKVDMLPKIQKRVLVIPELAPIFKDRQEDLVKNISYLIRVFDGEGLETDSGSKGRRGYTGDYLFAWLAATTPLDYRVWKLMGKLGSRWLFYKLKNTENGEQKRNGLIDNLTGEKSYKERAEECRKAVHSFLKLLWRDSGGVRGIKWDRNQDKELVNPLIRTAQLVTNVRSVVSVWREKDLQDYNYSQPEIEEPQRMAALLHNVARGHAIIQGRRQLNEDDIQICIDLAFNSMSTDRQLLLEFLLRNDGRASTTDITKNLNVSKPTALALMETLRVLGVVTMDEEEVFNEPKTIHLKEDFRWFLGEDFKGLRGGSEDELPF